MKGHVGGGSGYQQLQGAGGSVKVKSDLHVLHVSMTWDWPFSVNPNVQVRLLEMSLTAGEIPLRQSGTSNLRV
jgi:hypothetical protein